MSATASMPRAVMLVADARTCTKSSHDPKQPRHNHAHSSALTSKMKLDQLAAGPCCKCECRNFVVAYGPACTQDVNQRATSLHTQL